MPSDKVADLTKEFGELAKSLKERTGVFSSNDTMPPEIASLTPDPANPISNFAQYLVPPQPPQPVTPAVEAPPEVLKKLVQGQVERILSMTKTALGPDTPFPSNAAFLSFTVKEIVSFALMQMFAAVFDECAHEKDLNDRIVAFGRALRSDDIKALEKCFDRLKAEKQTSIATILRSLNYLKTKHAGDMSKKLVDFYPENQPAATVEDTKILAQRLIALQEKLTGKLIPAFKSIGDAMRKKAEASAEEVRKATSVAPHMEKLQQGGFSASIDLSCDLMRFMRQFSIYTSLRLEKAKKAMSRVKEEPFDETPVASLAALSSLNENLVHTKNSYAERFVSFINAMSDMVCISNGMYCKRKTVDQKLSELIIVQRKGVAILLIALREIIDEDIRSMADFRAIAIDILEDMRRSTGENIKKKKSRAQKHPKYEVIKDALKNGVENIANACNHIKSGGYVQLENMLKRDSVSVNSITRWIGSIIEGNGIAGLCSKMNTLGWMQFNISFFSLNIDDKMEQFKESLVQSTREENASVFHGNSAFAATSATSSIDELDSLSYTVEDLLACDYLLGLLTPLFSQCHIRLLEQLPKDITVDFDLLNEIEQPRTAKPRKNSGESSSSKGKTAVESVAEAVAPVPVQPKIETAAVDDADLEPPVAMFIATRKALLGVNNRSLKKADPHQIYHADAAYHLFHVVSLLDMITRGGTDQLRLFIPELMNATALVQEQMITPKYVEAANPEAVTHDLRKMSDALGIKTPFIFNYGSQNFRYPHSLAALHAHFHRLTPKWVEEMIVLHDQQEFASDEYLTKTMERVKTGLHFAIELVGSNELSAMSSKVDKHLNEVRYKGKSGEVGTAPMFEKLMGLLGEIDKKVAAKNNPKLTVAWKDLKVHALRLERAEKSLRQHKDQQYLSLHAKSIVMSAQYFIEHCGTLTALAVDGESLHTHRLSDYAALYDWETQLSKKQIETLKALDIEKGADYPTWALYNGRESAALELLSSAYEVATTAAENGEGFQSAEKGSHAPDQVRSALEAFVVDAVDLVTAVAALTKSRL